MSLDPNTTTTDGQTFTLVDPSHQELDKDEAELLNGLISLRAVHTPGLHSDDSMSFLMTLKSLDYEYDH